MSETKYLKNTRWLAERLGLSITTIERMRSKQPELLPPWIGIGKSIRYEESVVEQWLLDRSHVQPDLAAEQLEVSHG